MTGTWLGDPDWYKAFGRKFMNTGWKGNNSSPCQWTPTFPQPRQCQDQWPGSHSLARRGSSRRHGQVAPQENVSQGAENFMGSGQNLGPTAPLLQCIHALSAMHSLCRRNTPTNYPKYGWTVMGGHPTNLLAVQPHWSPTKIQRLTLCLNICGHNYWLAIAYPWKQSP